MPQTCTVCRHQHREEIDRALLTGEPFRNIAKRFGTSPTALFRHKADHLPRALALAKKAVREMEAGTLFERLRTINRETQEILEEARSSQNHIVALQAIGRVQKQLEFEARLLGELDDSTKVVIGINNNSQGPHTDLSHMSAEDLEAAGQLMLQAKALVMKGRLG